MKEPVVYYKPGCPFGLRLRLALTLHRVPHRSVRFRDDEEAAGRVRDVNTGNEISPTVHVAGRWLTNPGWRDVRDAANTVTRASVVAAAVLALLLTGCGTEASAPVAKSPDEVSHSAIAKAPAGSPLEGSWRAGPVSLGQTVATVRRHGLGRWVADYRANAPFRGDTVLTLTIKDGAWDLYGTSGDGEPAPIDYDAEYEIDGETVVFHHSDGSNTYRWKVDDDTLTLDFVQSTLPSYRGIPDEVFQRALYMTKAFTKQG